MKNNIMVAPSILSADFAFMGEAIKMLENSGADLVHCDVMDGVFVKNITFGPKMVKDIRKLTKLPLDCHLMIIEPQKYIGAFCDSGADYITIHREACGESTKKVLKEINALGVKSGVVINPDTDVKSIESVLEYCDMVLLMSVFPGFGGQKFIEPVLSKIPVLKSMIEKLGKDILIEIDGGITLENVKSATGLGVDVVVAGNTIFSAENPKKVIEKLKER